MERLEIEPNESSNNNDRDSDSDSEIQGNEEPIGCSTKGTLTFIVGLCAGTFSALLCKVYIAYIV